MVKNYAIALFFKSYYLNQAELAKQNTAVYPIFQTVAYCYYDLKRTNEPCSLKVYKLRYF